jgi:four helix bundle protein
MDEPASVPRFRFAHHRLDAYALAVEVVVETRRLVDGIPRGHRALADQALRAASSTVLLIAEGANRRTAADKRHRYSLARGECGEVAAAIEVAVALGFVGAAEASTVLDRAGRVCAMLLRLEQRFGPSSPSTD